MKKYFIFMSCFIFMLFVTMFLLACNNSTGNTESTTTQDLDKIKDKNQDEQESVEDEPLAWPEITENGVDEALFLENLDTDVLEAVATELQALVDEMIKEEQENPEIVLSEGFVRVFKSERYGKVLEMGDSAMKPLYWIIYKSPNAGTYEYICAMALYKLSGYDFSKEDGTLSWTNAKEFVKRFDEKILAERKRWK